MTDRRKLWYIAIGIFGFLAGEVGTQFWIWDRHLLRGTGIVWMLSWFYAVWRKS